VHVERIPVDFVVRRVVKLLMVEEGLEKLCGKLNDKERSRN